MKKGHARAALGRKAHADPWDRGAGGESVLQAMGAGDRCAQSSAERVHRRVRLCTATMRIVHRLHHQYASATGMEVRVFSGTNCRENENVGRASPGMTSRSETPRALDPSRALAAIGRVKTDCDVTQGCAACV